MCFMAKEISVGAVIFRRENKVEFLIVKRADNNKWEFPKGHMESGEAEIDTLKRELKEEAGFTNFRVIDGFREVINYTTKRNTERMLVYYLVASSQEFKISDEHTEFKWVIADEAVNYFKNSDRVEALKKALVSMIKKAEEFVR